MNNIFQKLKWLIDDLILWFKDKLDIRYNTPHKRLYDNGKWEETFTNTVFCDILYIWFFTAFIFEILLFLCGIDSESIVESIPILFFIHGGDDGGFIFWPGVILGGEGIFKIIVDWINQCQHINVISLDIPSGLSAVTGKSFQTVVHADYTYTFGFLKKGMDTKKGQLLCGNIHLCDLGYPMHKLEAFNSFF